jgi:short-subunit dehydrogenase
LPTTSSANRPLALITGASAGIGLELARVFARKGFDLVLVARRLDALEAEAGRLEGKHGARVRTFRADLSSLEAPTQIFDFTTNEHLQVDVLVNNAGAGLGGDFADTDIQRQLEIIQLNISALTHLTYLFLPAMIKRRAGWIMNVASTAAFQPGPFMAVYYASKAYVLSFSQAIAEELRKTGVTVSALCPGPTESEFAKTAHIGKTRLFRAKAAASAADVAEYAYTALMSGKRVAIPGTMNKLVAQANRVAPRILATKISRMLQEPL